MKCLGEGSLNEPHILYQLFYVSYSSRFFSPGLGFS